MNYPLLEDKAWIEKATTIYCIMRHLHVVLDESLDLVTGELLLAELDCVLFKLVAEPWWAEQNDSPANQQSKVQCRPASPTPSYTTGITE